VVNMRFAKPLDGELLDGIAARFQHVMTLEDNVVTGGMGSAVAEYYASRQSGVSLHIHGLPDRFVDHGSPEELYRDLGLDAEGIAGAIKDVLHHEKVHEG